MLSPSHALYLNSLKNFLKHLKIFKSVLNMGTLVLRGAGLLDLGFKASSWHSCMFLNTGQKKAGQKERKNIAKTLQ